MIGVSLIGRTCEKSNDCKKIGEPVVEHGADGAECHRDLDAVDVLAVRHGPDVVAEEKREEDSTRHSELEAVEADRHEQLKRERKTVLGHSLYEGMPPAKKLMAVAGSKAVAAIKGAMKKAKGSLYGNASAHAVEAVLVVAQAHVHQEGPGEEADDDDDDTHIVWTPPSTGIPKSPKIDESHKRSDAQVVLLPLTLWRFKTGLTQLNTECVRRMCDAGGFYSHTDNKCYKVAWPHF